MLSIDDARARVLGAITPLPSETVPIGQSVGRVLSADVVAASDSPRFDNSAMDGFAAAAGAPGRTLKLIGEARAGAPFAGRVGPGEAIRISTGAQMPADGQLGVLPLELATEAGGAVTFNDELTPGRNVRNAGEDLRAGATVLTAGTPIGPAELSVAINAGAGSVQCALRPRVAIVNTGDELVQAGAPLGPGEIYDSNGPMLAAMATLTGAEVISVGVARDDATATRDAIENALAADVVLLSGGVSVGPHDHVKPALEALGVREVFWRVALRPGKPTWFGSKDERLVFGLPGNPVSAYVTFVLFARPALRALQGADPVAPRGSARLGQAVERHAARDECIRVSIADGVATPTGPQGSHRSSSLAGADALAIIPRGEGTLAIGEQVAIEAL